MPRSLVADASFAWGADRPPGTPYRDTIIYEMHVEGFTATRRDVPGQLRGTYAGLACPPVVEYLAGLGVTAVDLLPVHQFVTTGDLAGRGLANYWGYDTIGFFAPHDGYSAAARAGRGAHLNPVITLLDRLFRGVSTAAAVIYIAAQVAGAIGGAILANLMFSLPALEVSTKVRSGGGLGLG